MKLDDLRFKMIDMIKNMPERKELIIKEKAMMNDGQALKLIANFQTSLDDYNFSLKTFGENNQLTKNNQKKLFEAKLEMDNYPAIYQYNQCLNKCNEPLHYLENNLFKLFSNRRNFKC